MGLDKAKHIHKEHMFGIDKKLQYSREEERGVHAFETESDDSLQTSDSGDDIENLENMDIGIRFRFSKIF
jgi:hypothetical protein